MALHATENRLQELNSSLSQFQYTDKRTSRILMEELDRLEFYGTTVSLMTLIRLNIIIMSWFDCLLLQI